jgi:hypothetical protein
MDFLQAEIATLNLATNEIEYQKPSGEDKIIVRAFLPNEFFVVGISENNVCFRVTNQHDLVIWEDGKWVKRKACEVLGKTVWMPAIQRFEVGKTKVTVIADTQSTQAYQEYVWCLNVPNTTLVTRRWGGETIIVGNCIGRGTRTLPGTIDEVKSAIARRASITQSSKPVLEVLDFVGNSGRHRLVTSVDVLAGKYSDEVVDKARKNIEKSEEPAEVMSELQKAEKELEQERLERLQKAKRAKVRARARYSTATINPFDVLDIEPHRERGWNVGKPPSDKQIGLLQKFGVDTSGLSRTHASQLIGQLLNMRRKKLCTFKQARCLVKYGYDPKDVTFDQASELITAIAANGWKRLA